MSEQFVGSIIIAAFQIIPRGWLPCDGQLLAINTHQELYALIGTQYGGDGITTFALPDFRGRVPVCQGSKPGLTSRSVGQTGGKETVTLSTAQLPAHTHTAMAATTASSSVPTNLMTWAGNPDVPLFSNGNADVAMNSQAVVMTGGGSDHNNMSPFVVMRYLICVSGAFGLFPVQ